MFFAVIFIHGLRLPNKEKPPPATAQERWRSLVDLMPTSLLILIVLGTIYGGIATPTEAAAGGGVAARVLAKVAPQIKLKKI